MKRLTHIDARGEASMVDVSAKPVMFREAVASGEVRLQRTTLKLIESQTIAKGNVLAAARLAGILAAKKTGELIPLCHPLPSRLARSTLPVRRPWIALSLPLPPKSQPRRVWKWKLSQPSALPV